jgi:hypothetical protein
MQLYCRTQLGKRIVSDRTGSQDELRVLDYLAANKTATDDQLEVAGADRFMVKEMMKSGLIKELTT